MSQSTVDGLYVGVQELRTPDSVNKTYTITYLKIQGTRCFMDVSTVAIKGFDTLTLSDRRTGLCFRGSVSKFGGFYNFKLQEVIIDYFERLQPLDERGIPIPKREIRFLFGEFKNEELLIDGHSLRKVAYEKLLCSEDLKNY